MEYNTESIKKYLGGLFDGGGSVYFRVSKSNRCLGYRITPMIVIHIGKDDELYGMIDELFVSNCIQYKLSENSSGGTRIKIDTKDNIKKFFNLIGDYTVQHKLEVEFILSELYPARECGDILDKRYFLGIIETVETIQPRRAHNDGVKYTTEFFEEMWSVEREHVGLDFSVKKETVSREYMCGLFDGAGKIRPVIHQTEKSQTGFTLGIRASITRSWLRTETLDVVRNYLEQEEIRYNVNHQQNRVSVQITHCSDLADFLDLIGPSLISKYNIALMVRSKVVPAIEEDYHHERQGLHDIVWLFENYMDNTDQRKYTSEYFRNQWDNVTIEISDTDRKSTVSD